MIGAEKAAGHQRKRRNNRYFVDFQDNFITNFAVQSLPLLLSHPADLFFSFFQVILHDDRFTDVDVNPAEAFTQHLAALDHVRRVFLDFGNAGKFLQVRFFFNHPVIADVNGNGGQIIAVLFFIGLQNHGKKPVPGHYHFAGAAAAAFNEEFERQTFPQKSRDIFGKHFPVNYIAPKTAPQKKSAGLAKDITHGEKGHVVARRNKRQLNIIFIKNIGQQQIIDMAPMTGNNYKRHLFGDVANPGQAFHIHQDAVIDGIPEPGEQFIPEFNEHLIVISRNFIQIAAGVFFHGSPIPVFLRRVLINKLIDRIVG